MLTALRILRLGGVLSRLVPLRSLARVFSGWWLNLHIHTLFVFVGLKRIKCKHTVQMSALSVLLECLASDVLP